MTEPQDCRYLLTAHNDSLAQTTVRPRFFVRTYGCQMNDRDSEKMTALLSRLGYDAAEGQDDADFILYNTCCVRESAEDKVFGHLSRLKRAKADKPGLMIGVCGCMTQQPDIAQKFQEKHPYVNLVFGTSNRHRLPEFLWRAIQTGKPVIDITESDELPEIEDIPVTTRDFPHKAGVNIMYGCDNFCAYCIVPYVRGRERSRPPEDILREAESLADDGVKEVMLLGQNVNSYGGGVAFPELLRQVNAISGLERIRFMTSHPKDFSDELILAIRDLPKVCKHVHLPLQSGSTRVLADMNRMYSQEDYLALAARLQAAIPGIAITTDIIVGYPGETEEDFLATLDVARQIRFAGAFTFIYSKRSGTPAAEREDTVPRKEISERFDRLTATLYPIMEEINRTKIGKVIDVMVEDSQSAKGRADDHTLVHFTACKELKPGDIVPVRINEAKTFYISGDAIAPHPSSRNFSRARECESA
ncbi:MAG: tRNA (N6-isopentenyl adenosine(37)-C2)-methylthiotransferase MiaB [Defluviitaleaceae bacterium]|nr:tRNA (N6-isopentenyl adenosine(37)-C2)-methylthiotransferase MiaB [Defluviitaleaceae bacterium]